jgi:hypothetical protein
MPPRIEIIEKPYPAGVTKETYVHLDWYERLGIPLVKSTGRAEQYPHREEGLMKRELEIVPIFNELYCLVLNEEMYDDTKGMNFNIFEAVEKLTIAYHFKNFSMEKHHLSLFDGRFPFLRMEGQKPHKDQYKIDPLLLWLALVKLDLDEVVIKAIEAAGKSAPTGYRFVFQVRRPWQIEYRDFELNDVVCTTRFGFGFVPSIQPMSEDELTVR